MVKNVLGIILMLIGAFIAIVLFTYGGPIFPHITGPVVFVSVGAFLFWFKGRDGQAS